MNQQYKDFTEKAEAYIRTLFTGEASGHDVHHSLRVYRTAMRIAEVEGGDQRIVALAALLHDADDDKLFPEHIHQENARAFMMAEGVEDTVCEAVCRAIGQISFKGSGKTVPDTLEGRIVQDADRLDAIGAIGIARVFAFGGNRGRAIYEPEETPKLNMTAEAYRANRGSSVNHFYEKLFLLRDLMNTPTARTLAEERHRFMKAYMDEFYREWNGEA